MEKKKCGVNRFVGNIRVDAANIDVPEQVQLKDRPGGEVIGTARLVTTSDGNIIATMDVKGEAERLIQGSFSLGDFSIVEGN